jgi:uncharacterized membrane protein (DUF2068 family)
MDWSQLACGTSGHTTFEPDEPALRERLGVATTGGMAWRCLRCGTFVIGAPAYHGPAASAPRVRRDSEVRSFLVLRVFAIERFLRALVFAALGYGIWRFKTSRLSIEQAFNNELPGLRLLFRELGYNIDHSKLLGLIQHAFTLNQRTLTYLAAGAAAYAGIEIVEGIGLWLGKRWGEYFAVVVTSLGLPYEVYDLTAKVTVLRAVAFAINLALVVYLLVTRRLFGIRGGKKAYEARLRSASILDAELAALAAQDDQAVPAGPASELAASPATAGTGEQSASEPGQGVPRTASATTPPVQPSAAAAGEPRPVRSEPPAR